MKSVIDKGNTEVSPVSQREKRRLYFAQSTYIRKKPTAAEIEELQRQLALDEEVKEIEKRQRERNLEPAQILIDRVQHAHTEAGTKALKELFYTKSERERMKISKQHHARQDAEIEWAKKKKEQDKLETKKRYMKLTVLNADGTQTIYESNTYTKFKGIKVDWGLNGFSNTRKLQSVFFKGFHDNFEEQHKKYFEEQARQIRAPKVDAIFNKKYRRRIPTFPKCQPPAALHLPFHKKVQDKYVSASLKIRENKPSQFSINFGNPQVPGWLVELSINGFKILRAIKDCLYNIEDIYNLQRPIKLLHFLINNKLRLPISEIDICKVLRSIPNDDKPGVSFPHFLFALANPCLAMQKNYFMLDPRTVCCKHFHHDVYDPSRKEYQFKPTIIGYKRGLRDSVKPPKPKTKNKAKIKAWEQECAELPERVESYIPLYSKPSDPIIVTNTNPGERDDDEDEKPKHQHVKPNGGETESTRFKNPSSKNPPATSDPKTTNNQSFEQSSKAMKRKPKETRTIFKNKDYHKAIPSDAQLFKPRRPTEAPVSSHSTKPSKSILKNSATITSSPALALSETERIQKLTSKASVPSSKVQSKTTQHRLPRSKSLHKSSRRRHRSRFLTTKELAKLPTAKGRVDPVVKKKRSRSQSRTSSRSRRSVIFKEQENSKLSEAKGKKAKRKHSESLKRGQAKSINSHERVSRSKLKQPKPFQKQITIPKLKAKNRSKSKELKRPKSKDNIQNPQKSSSKKIAKSRAPQPTGAEENGGTKTKPGGHDCIPTPNWTRTTPYHLIEYCKEHFRPPANLHPHHTSGMSIHNRRKTDESLHSVTVKPGEIAENTEPKKEEEDDDADDEEGEESENDEKNDSTIEDGKKDDKDETEERESSHDEDGNALSENQEKTGETSTAVKRKRKLSESGLSYISQKFEEVSPVEKTAEDLAAASDDEFDDLGTPENLSINEENVLEPSGAQGATELNLAGVPCCGKWKYLTFLPERNRRKECRKLYMERFAKHDKKQFTGTDDKKQENPMLENNENESMKSDENAEKISATVNDEANEEIIKEESISSSSFSTSTCSPVSIDFKPRVNKYTAQFEQRMVVLRNLSSNRPYKSFRGDKEAIKKHKQWWKEFNKRDATGQPYYLRKKINRFNPENVDSSSSNSERDDTVSQRRTRKGHESHDTISTRESEESGEIECDVSEDIQSNRKTREATGQLSHRKHKSRSKKRRRRKSKNSRRNSRHKRRSKRSKKSKSKSKSRSESHSRKRSHAKPKPPSRQRRPSETRKTSRTAKRKRPQPGHVKVVESVIPTQFQPVEDSQFHFEQSAPELNSKSGRVEQPKPQTRAETRNEAEKTEHHHHHHHPHKKCDPLSGHQHHHHHDHSKRRDKSQGAETSEGKPVPHKFRVPAAPQYNVLKYETWAEQQEKQEEFLKFFDDMGITPEYFLLLDYEQQFELASKKVEKKLELIGNQAFQIRRREEKEKLHKANLKAQALGPNEKCHLKSIYLVTQRQKVKKLPYEPYTMANVPVIDDDPAVKLLKSKEKKMKKLKIVTITKDHRQIESNVHRSLLGGITGRTFERPKRREKPRHAIKPSVLADIANEFQNAERARRKHQSQVEKEIKAKIRQIEAIVPNPGPPEKKICRKLREEYDYYRKKFAHASNDEKLIYWLFERPPKFAKPPTPTPTPPLSPKYMYPNEVAWYDRQKKKRLNLRKQRKAQMKPEDKVPEDAKPLPPYPENSENISGYSRIEQVFYTGLLLFYMYELMEDLEKVYNQTYFEYPVSNRKRAEQINIANTGSAGNLKTKSESQKDKLSCYLASYPLCYHRLVVQKPNRSEIIKGVRSKTTIKTVHMLARLKNREGSGGGGKPEILIGENRHRIKQALRVLAIHNPVAALPDLHCLIHFTDPLLNVNKNILRNPEPKKQLPVKPKCDRDEMGWIENSWKDLHQVVGLPRQAQGAVGYTTVYSKLPELTQLIKNDQDNAWKDVLLRRKKCRHEMYNRMNFKYLPPGRIHDMLQATFKAFLPKKPVMNYDIGNYTGWL